MQLQLQCATVGKVGMQEELCHGMIVNAKLQS